MQSTPDLRILFPTSFSDACFRTSRAIAQLADVCRVSLTIAHATNPDKATIRTRRELDSFLAEADHYDYCRRVLLEGEDPVEAIAALCEREPFDLVLAPASDRLGIHKFFAPSFRARLLKQCTAPLWTAGSCLDRGVLKPSIKTVACLLDFNCATDSHLRLAASLARRTGAAMRVVTVVEPTSEATLARSFQCRAPLVPGVALEKIHKMFAGRECPEVDVAVGETPRELHRMLARCDADIVFVGPGQALDRLWTLRLSPYLDRLPCPVICVDGGSSHFNAWTFQQESDAHRSTEVARNRAIAS